MFTSDLIRLALEEDSGSGDITSDAVVPKTLAGRGVILAKQDLVLAGLGVAFGVFLSIDPTTKIRKLAWDGDSVPAGTRVAEIAGFYRNLLRGERVALNFLQRLCGVATLTRSFVLRTEGTKTKILDTRKTTPLVRHLEKYAVRMGGGSNHRFGLSDAVLIKDNHIAACKGDVAEAVRKMKKKCGKKPITVEVTRVEEVEPAIGAGATRLLLDNMADPQVECAVALARGRVEIEVSGGITRERVARLSKIGVDYISVGALTHSAPAADLSFEVLPS
ncbi:MAG: carboxylating nicotinate-nucleotide diphosphorylase [Pseudomonadota bacterium]